MNHRKSLCLAVLGCSMALPAQAETLSSSYLDAAYLNSSVDTGGPTEDEVEGFRVATSVGLAPFLNFVADYDKRRYQDSHDGHFAIGLAGHTTDPVWQAFVAATYERAHFDDNKSQAGDHEEEGYGAEAGIRAVLPLMEVHGSYKYFDLGEAAPEVALTGSRYGGGVAIDLTSWWSLTGDYRVRTHEFEDSSTATTATSEIEFTEWTVGLRRYFVTQTDRGNRTGGLWNALFGGGEEAAQ